MNKADKAESLFRTGYNCNQSVYAKICGRTGNNSGRGKKKASPFERDLASRVRYVVP